MPHSFSQPALTTSRYPSFQLSATWNPANGTSSPAGSSTLTISMSWLRQRSLLPSTLSSTRPNLSSQRTRHVRRDMSALQACLQLYAASRRRGRQLLFDVRLNAFHLFFAEGAHGS